MDSLVTFIYLVFCVTVVYPPTEFVAAGFTIPALFDNYLGSENINFVSYHMKRISLTYFIHSCLPLGYVFCLWMKGETSQFLLPLASLCFMLPVIVSYKLLTWWEKNRRNNPIAKCLSRYAHEGSDWRVVAADVNTEYRRVDKVMVQLSTLSKFVATENWFMMITQYDVIIIKQIDCALMAITTDVFNLTPVGEEEIQYITMEAVPLVNNFSKFKFRLTTASLRELQPRLINDIVVPDHVNLQQTAIDRFLIVFKQYVDTNPPFVTDQVPELCIGCLQTMSDVKLHRRCDLSQPNFDPDAPDQCQICNCRVLWCWACMGRWYASRAPRSRWLEERGSCPLCRARFCLKDVCPVILDTSAH